MRHSHHFLQVFQGDMRVELGALVILVCPGSLGYGAGPRGYGASGWPPSGGRCTRHDLPYPRVQILRVVLIFPTMLRTLWRLGFHTCALLDAFLEIWIPGKGQISKNGRSVKGDGNEVSARACPAPGLPRGSPTDTNCPGKGRLGSGLKAPRGGAWRLHPNAKGAACLKKWSRTSG